MHDYKLNVLQHFFSKFCLQVAKNSQFTELSKSSNNPDKNVVDSEWW